MSAIKYFRENSCPRCHSNQFFRLGDAHYTVTTLLEEDGAQTKPAPDLTRYVKACRSCAYVEFYSKFLIDDFEATEAALGAFGVITEAPSGDHLLSIFWEYEHRGRSARDFTIPIPSDRWFELSIALERLSDKEVVEAVLDGPYLRAWTERIGPIPPDLGKNLRALIAQYLDKPTDAA